MNFTHYTLGEALSNPNETIKRNAMSILKQLQKERDKEAHIMLLKIKNNEPNTTPLEVIRNSKKIIELQNSYSPNAIGADFYL